MKNCLISPSNAIVRLEKRGLRQQQIASLLGISQGAVNKIKSQKIKNVSYIIVDKLRLLVTQLSTEEVAAK